MTMGHTGSPLLAPKKYQAWVCYKFLPEESDVVQLSEDSRSEFQSLGAMFIGKALSPELANLEEHEAYSW